MPDRVARALHFTDVVDSTRCFEQVRNAAPLGPAGAAFSGAGD